MVTTMNVNDEPFVFGLGYFHHGSMEDPARGGLNGPPELGGSSGSNTVCDATNAADMAQALMMQCLAYHQEQEATRQQTNGQTRLLPEAEVFPEFVGASERGTASEWQPHHCQDYFKGEITPPQSYNSAQQTTTQQQPEIGYAINTNEINPSICTSSDDAPKSLDSLIEAARARARAVLAQFNQTGDLPLTSGKCKIENDENNKTSDPELSFQPATQHPPHYYAQQREIGLQREEQRKHRALIKNLEYVSHKESVRIGMLQAAQDQVAQWERIGQQLYQKNLAIRREQLLIQKGHGRKHIDSHRKPKRPRSNAQNQPLERNSAMTVSIYVSGFPVSGPDAVSEDSARQLFGAYGEIARVHVYRDNRTQALKGDGLIVYSVDEQDDIPSFLASVCGQVRSRNWCRTLKHTIVEERGITALAK